MTYREEDPGDGIESIDPGVPTTRVEFWDQSGIPVYVDSYAKSFFKTAVDADVLEVRLVDNLAIRDEVIVELTPVPAVPLLAVISWMFVVFLSRPIREAVVGDFQERYAERLNHCGRTHAMVWFWKQVVISLAPFAWATLKRVSGLEVILRRIGR